MWYSEHNLSCLRKYRSSIAEKIALDFTGDDSFFLAEYISQPEFPAPGETCRAYMTNKAFCAHAPHSNGFCLKHYMIKQTLDRLKKKDYSDLNVQIWCRLKLYLGFYRDKCPRHLEWIKLYNKKIHRIII